MADLTEQLSVHDKLERDELAKGIREVLVLPGGRRVLFWLLEQTAIYRDAFTGEDAATNYTLGQQSVGRKLIAQMDMVDPRLYPTLLMQAADQRLLDHAAAKAQAEAAKPEDDE